MKKNLFFFLVLMIALPTEGFCAWFKLFSTQSADLFLDTSSIKRENNSIFFHNLLTTEQNNQMECYL